MDKVSEQPLNWLESMRLRRDKVLASPKFQTWAASFPLTRWVARRRARQLFDICAGFTYSQTLLACVRLQVFDALSAGPVRAEDFAAEQGLAVDRARRLLDAAAAIGLVRSAGTRYALGPLGAALQGQPGLAAMIEHHDLFYRDLLDPVSLLRDEPTSQALRDFWAYSRSSAPKNVSAERAASYSELMSRSQSLVAEQIFAAYSPNQHQRILDLGGGDGTFLIRASTEAPEAELILFDLPAVAELATANFARVGLASRATAVGGNFLEDALPSGADLITMIRVLHDHDDDAVFTMLRRAREALAPGGRLLVAEPLAGTSGAEVVGDAYFGLYLLAMGQGRARTEAQITEMLKECGFSSLRWKSSPIPLQSRVVIAFQ